MAVVWNKPIEFWFETNKLITIIIIIIIIIKT
jgi:hypothetical protein